MAKRVPLSNRRAGDARGIDALFNPSSPPEAIEPSQENTPEQELVPVPTDAPEQEPSEEPSEEPAAAHPGEPAPSALSSGRETEKPATEKPALAKVTLYIRPDQVEAIEEIQLAQRRKTGRKPDKSDLVQEALDLLVEKYRSP